jgi:hypothetical protein
VERLRSDGEDERQRFREARATLGPLLADAAAEIERLRADLAHADAKGQENDKLLWGTIKANERLQAALDVVRASGLLIGSTTLHDKVRAVVHAALTEERA